MRRRLRRCRRRPDEAEQIRKLKFRNGLGLCHMNHGLNYVKAAAHLEMSIHVDPDNQWVLLAEGTLAAEEAEAVGGKEYHAW